MRPAEIISGFSYIRKHDRTAVTDWQNDGSLFNVININAWAAMKQTVSLLVYYLYSIVYCCVMISSNFRSNLTRIWFWAGIMLVEGPPCAVRQHNNRSYTNYHPAAPARGRKFGATRREQINKPERRQSCCYPSRGGGVRRADWFMCHEGIKYKIQIFACCCWCCSSLLTIFEY